MEELQTLIRTRFIAGKWVLPVIGPPIENGVLGIDGEKILSLHSRRDFERQFPNRKIERYDQSIIMPGLINLHTHVDYTHLSLFDTGSHLFHWIKDLVERSRRWTKSQWYDSALDGCRQIALSGTSCIADSSYNGTAAYACAQIGLRSVVGLELFGISNQDVDRQWHGWLEKYACLEAEASQPLKDCLESGLIALTVAPHAPYTVSPLLWSKAKSWAEARNLPVFTHLAESDLERQWIAQGEMQVDKFLQSMFACQASDLGQTWRGSMSSPVTHLHAQGLLTESTVAAHCTKLDDADIALLSQAKTKVAHCPRSNARLRNGIAPLSRLLESGVQVGFGTDSLASNYDLDLMAEARFAWSLQRAINPGFSLNASQAIYALTLGAARCLGIDHLVGSLEPGKQADIAIFSGFEFCKAQSANPYDLLLYGQTRLEKLLVNGKCIVENSVIQK